MPREAKLFLSSSGSAARGFLRFHANIPPRWIRNAQKSRKRIEPEIVDALRSVRSIQRNRPRAQVALKNEPVDYKTIPAEHYRALTTVAHKPSIVIEQATSSYSFRSSELSQPI